jgi:hypothetical protein
VAKGQRSLEGNQNSTNVTKYKDKGYPRNVLHNLHEPKEFTANRVPTPPPINRKEEIPHPHTFTQDQY